MSKLWILTANSSFAKIFEVTGHGRQILEIKHVDFPNGRKKDGDIVSDRPGRSFDRMGASRHALSTEVSIHDHELKIFATQLATILQEARLNKAFDELALVMPAHFLGLFHQAISDAVKKCISKEVSKDLPEHLSDKERIDSLCKYFDLWNRAPL